MFKRDENSFVWYAKKLRKLLNKGNHDSALARYNRLKAYYDMLDDDKKLIHEYEFNSMVKQIMLYLKIDELRVVIKGDDLDLMRDYLNEMDYLNNTTFDMPANYRKFVMSSYEKYLNEFNYRIVLSELNELLELVYKLKSEENFDQALHLFPKIMFKFREMSGHGVDTKETYRELINLREELKVELLKLRAYSSEAKTDIRVMKKALRKRDLESARKLHERVFS
jgi:hypothetical protein